MSQELTESWSLNFGETPPLSDWMRWHHHNRWFRIHSLPESKRYADNEEEMSIVLERANAIATHVLGDQQEVWMISSTPSDYRSEYENDESEPIKRFDLSYWHIWIEPDDDPECRYEWTSFARKLRWCSGEYNSLLKRIADDEVERVLWFSSELSTVFAPYDGGVDVWVKTEEQLDSLYHRYKHWMSNRDDWM